MKSELIFAKSKYMRISPKKTALVLGLIRGKSFEEAQRVLQFTPNKPAKVILKTLESASANASNTKSVKAKDLRVKEAYVGPGPLIKRMRIVGRSRTSPILKRTSHVVIGLERSAK